MKINKEVKILFWAHVVLAVYLVYILFDLITVLYDEAHLYGFLSNELNNKDYVASQPQIIPKIIHQTYKTEAIPEIWQEGQRKCQELNPDYQYILWTDEMAREFIAEQYPWFLDTFDNYKFPIERADAIRYFVLAQYGGIYIDLDDGCERNLDPLLTVPAFVRQTLPTGISNDIMGAVPQHPMFVKAIAELKMFNYNWLVPYITIMYSTGPLFISMVFKRYIRWGYPPSGGIRIMSLQDYKLGPNPFFKISKGSSWHKDDASFMFFMLHHLPSTIIGGFLLAFFLMYCEYLIVCLVVRLFGARISKMYNSISQKFTDLFHSVYSICTGDKSSKWQRLPSEPKKQVRKSRKDSNLPRALVVDLEKNVNIVEDDIQEE